MPLLQLHQLLEIREYELNRLRRGFFSIIMDLLT